MTPREAGIQAFYADESTSNTLQGLNAAFDAYEAAAKLAHDEIIQALEWLATFKPFGSGAVGSGSVDAGRVLLMRDIAIEALSKAKEG